MGLRDQAQHEEVLDRTPRGLSRTRRDIFSRSYIGEGAGTMVPRSRIWTRRSTVVTQAGRRPITSGLALTTREES